MNDKKEIILLDARIVGVIDKRAFYAVLRKLFVRRVTPVGSTIEDTQLAANVDDTHGSALTHRPMTARAKV